MKRLFYPLGFLLGLTSTLLAAPVTIWEDDFNASSFNPNLALYRNYTGVNATQGGGTLVYTSTIPNNFAGVHLWTRTDENGATDADGKGVYDFFHRPISVTLSGPTFSGPLTAGIGYNLFMLLGIPNGNDPANLTPRTAFSGAFARLNYDAGGVWSITVGDRVIGGSAVTETLALNGAPSDVRLTLNGTAWEVALSGTTFSVGGAAVATGTLTQLTAAHLTGATAFSLGTIQTGDLAAGSVPYSISLSGLEILSPAVVVPEPGSVALVLGGMVLLAGWARRK